VFVGGVGGPVISTYFVSPLLPSICNLFLCGSRLHLNIHTRPGLFVTKLLHLLSRDLSTIDHGRFVTTAHLNTLHEKHTVEIHARTHLKLGYIGDTRSYSVSPVIRLIRDAL
jgi:hypothetical protein